MDSEGRTQAVEMPFNMSDYVNFDLDDADTLNPAVGSSPRNSLAKPRQDMCVDDSYVGFDDADETNIASMFESSDRSNASGFSFNAAEIASDGETKANFLTLSSTSEASDMTDTFQTKSETDAMPNDLNMFEPMAFASPAAPRSPSRWYRVSSQLQQQLNTLYASQLARLGADANPPPVLYLPAEGQCASPPPSNWSMLYDDLTQTDCMQTPQLSAEPLPVDPSLLMQKKEEVVPTLPAPNGTYRPILPTTDSYVSDSEDAIFRPSKKHGLYPDDSKAEPATKRARIAKMLTTAVESVDSNNENDAEMTRAQSPRQNTVPNAAKDEQSDDESADKAENDPKDECDDNDSSGLSSAPSSPATEGTSVPLSSNPNWRYEQAKETRLRNQRRNEWNQRRTNGAGAKGEAPNRKMQKLLGEIEDSVEFAEARGYEVKGNVGEDGVLRRSARRGVRKIYAGLE